MGKSLSSLLSDITGVENSTPTSQSSILVKCPNCGKESVARGYDKETLCSHCRIITDANNELLTSGVYSFARDKTLMKKKISVLIPAVDKGRTDLNTIDDRT